MFRDTNGVRPDNEFLGAGSVVLEGPSTQHVIIAISRHKVALMSLSSFETTAILDVQDSNYLSESEARDLAHLIGCTISDLSFDTTGIKQYRSVTNY